MRLNGTSRKRVAAIWLAKKTRETARADGSPCRCRNVKRWKKMCTQAMGVRAVTSKRLTGNENDDPTLFCSQLATHHSVVATNMMHEKHNTVLTSVTVCLLMRELQKLQCASLRGWSLYVRCNCLFVLVSHVPSVQKNSLINYFLNFS